MMMATLIAAPGGLDPALAESLRNAWCGGDLVWLSPDEAAEFPLAAARSNAPAVWADLQAQGVDLAIQPAEGRRKSILLADMDSTMIHQECVDELADMAGVGARVAAITARAMNGELDFEAALDERVALLAGLDAAIIDRVYAERITFMPGGRTLIATMRAQGGFAMLVSGGFTAFTARVAADLGFDRHRANVLLTEDGKLTGTVRKPVLGREAKLETLHAIAAERGVTPAEVIAVGDGMNDMLMLANAGTGVALHGKPALQAEVDLRVNHGDLTALLFLQGYARSEFVD